MIFETDHLQGFSSFSLSIFFTSDGAWQELSKSPRVPRPKTSPQSSAHDPPACLLEPTSLETVTMTEDRSWSPWMTISQRCGNESTCCRSAMTQRSFESDFGPKKNENQEPSCLKMFEKRKPPRQQKLSPCKVSRCKNLWLFLQTFYERIIAQKSMFFA